MDIIIANILNLIGQLFVFYAASRNDKKQILFYQIISVLFMASCSLILKGYTAIVMDAVTVGRNILSIYSISSKTISIVFTGLAVVFGVLFNNLGFLGLLPIVANVVQTVVILNEKSTTRQVQLVSAFGCFCWAIYNLVIHSYTGLIFDSVNGFSFLLHAFKGEEA